VARQELFEGLAEFIPGLVSWFSANFLLVGVYNLGFSDSKKVCCVIQFLRFALMFDFRRLVIRFPVLLDRGMEQSAADCWTFRSP
jgi:hypothetical protein